MSINLIFGILSHSGGVVKSLYYSVDWGLEGFARWRADRLARGLEGVLDGIDESHVQSHNCFLDFYWHRYGDGVGMHAWLKFVWSAKDGNYWQNHWNLLDVTCRICSRTIAYDNCLIVGIGITAECSVIVHWEKKSHVHIECGQTGRLDRSGRDLVLKLQLFDWLWG